MSTHHEAEKKVDILETTSKIIEAKRILHVIQETWKERFHLDPPQEIAI